MVLDGEMVRIFSILPHERKKPSFFDSKDLLEMFTFDLIPQVAFKEFFDLIRSKMFV